MPEPQAREKVVGAMSSSLPMCSGCCNSDDKACAALISNCENLIAPDTEFVEEFPGASRAFREQDGEFEIVLDKRKGTPLGIDIVYWENNTLLVEAVVGGLVEEWNKKHPKLSVQSGDVLLEVNGIRGDRHRLVDECTKRSTLKVTFRRGAMKK
eukprot:CAMPEP_0206495910 /NCGR_PEP_ID=MMETSP0324_2-20121206/48972_1 /ASSEMBLY_ACC=CAM_ASM_000836 /TAXON_ID=2866 /ORGANISM="Crypthecodinium cohnii, Strain Seligo" /LENGTH=153 /DNA_ID=CAMNT_0053980581 /DNA_START=66 /DNA_END=527 /DNA_ORIENTATION=-